MPRTCAPATRRRRHEAGCIRRATVTCAVALATCLPPGVLLAGIADATASRTSTTTRPAPAPTGASTTRPTGDACALLRPATVKALLAGAEPDGAPTKRRTDYCGWHSAGFATHASVLYSVTDEQDARARFKTFAALPKETPVTGLGDEAVASRSATLSAISVRKGKVFLHIESGGRTDARVDLVKIAKELLATGRG